MRWGVQMRLVRLFRHRRDDDGAAAVEFALVVVPLLYIVFGVISYGYMLSFRQSISQAAAEGARAAAVTPGGISNPDLLAGAQAAINDALNSYAVTCASTSGAEGSLTHNGDPAGTCEVELLDECTGFAAAQCVKVTLNYTYGDDSLLPDVGYGYVMPDNLSFSSEVRVS